MDLQRKEQRLREAVESLTRHDDEPIGEIAAALARVFEHAEAEVKEALGRRERAAAELEQQRQAKDADDAAQRSAQAGDADRGAL